MSALRSFLNDVVNAAKETVDVVKKKVVETYDDVKEEVTEIFNPAGKPPTLRLGDKGKDGWVKYLQQLLGVGVDGDFGPKTLEALRAFQEQQQLEANGIAGDQTWAALRGGAPAEPGSCQIPDSITINPGFAVIAEGEGMQFEAKGWYSDGSSKDLTTEVAWDCPVVEFFRFEGNGFASTSKPWGSEIVRITATYPGVETAWTEVTVVARKEPAAEPGVCDEPVLRLTISPADLTMLRGERLHFYAEGKSESSTWDLTSSVVWSSSDEQVIKFDPSENGLATAKAGGKATLTACDDASSVTAWIEVTVADLLEMMISANLPMTCGEQQDFHADGLYSDGDTLPLPGPVDWSSTDTHVIDFGPNGHATARVAGKATVTARYRDSDVSASIEVTVVPALTALISIKIYPEEPLIVEGKELKFTAIGLYLDYSSGSPNDYSRDLTSEVDWSSSADKVVSIDNGVASAAVGLGTVSPMPEIVTITARTPDIAASIEVKVAPALKEITINNQTDPIYEGDELELTVTGKYSNGATKDLTDTVVWSSTDDTVVWFDNGLPKADHGGEATLTALDEASGVSAWIVVTVRAIDVARGDKGDTGEQMIEKRLHVMVHLVETYWDNYRDGLSAFTNDKLLWRDVEASAPVLKAVLAFFGEGLAKVAEDALKEKYGILGAALFKGVRAAYHAWAEETDRQAEASAKMNLKDFLNDLILQIGPSKKKMTDAIEDNENYAKGEYGRLADEDPDHEETDDGKILGAAAKVIHGLDAANAAFDKATPTAAVFHAKLTAAYSASMAGN